MFFREIKLAIIFSPDWYGNRLLQLSGGNLFTELDALLMSHTTCNSLLLLYISNILKGAERQFRVV